MSAIRRGYVYLMCAVSLLVAIIGLINLLTIGALHAWNAITGSWLFDSAATEVRESLSLYLALTAVAVPIFLIHWRLASRWSRGERGQDERQSLIRGVYFAVVAVVALQVWAAMLGSIIDSALVRAFGGVVFSTIYEAVFTIIIVGVAATIWAAHSRVRISDYNESADSHATRWPDRIYLYGAIFISLMIMLSGIVELFAVAIDAVIEDGMAAFRLGWTGEPLSGAITRTLVGGLVWSIHWGYALTLIRGGSADSPAPEAASTIRRAMLHLVIFICVVAIIVLASLALNELLRQPLGADPRFDPVLAEATRWLVISIPLLVCWWYYRRQTMTEAIVFGGVMAATSARRLHQYMVMLVAIVAGAIGAGYLLGVLLEFLFEWTRLSSGSAVWRPGEASAFLSFTLVGGAVWLGSWAAIQRAIAGAPEQERSRPSRRGYLYLVLGFTTLALLVTVAIVLYQLLQVVLGLRDMSGLAEDIGALLGVAIVAGGLLAYHLRRLLEDAGSMAADGPVGTVPPVEIAPAASATLLLTAPDVARLREALDAIRARLPSGISLDELEAAAEPDRTPEHTPVDAPGSLPREDNSENDFLPENDDPTPQRSTL